MKAMSELCIIHHRKCHILPVRESNVIFKTKINKSPPNKSQPGVRNVAGDKKGCYVLAFQVPLLSKLQGSASAKLSKQNVWVIYEEATRMSHQNYVL